MDKNMAIIAVTGGMGCGQSTVCEFLSRMGVKVIDADLVARKEIERNEELKKELKQAFGRKIFYGNAKLNRKLLAKIAFSDEAKTSRLNRIVHPWMVAKVIDLIEQIRDTRSYSLVAVDAALIYELNLEKMFDAVIVVSSKMENRLERIRKRDKLSNKEIRERINKQIPLEDKAQWADFVIENNGDLNSLENYTKHTYSKLQNFLKRKRN